MINTITNHPWQSATHCQDSNRTTSVSLDQSRCQRPCSNRIGCSLSGHLLRVTFVAACLAMIGIGPLPLAHGAVVEQQLVPEAKKEKAAEENTANDTADSADHPDESIEDVIDTASQPAVPSMAGNQIKLHMWDGSIVGGKVSVSQINVQTDFGMMTIPISKIIAFYPGLESLPQKQSKLNLLVKQLGDATYQTRETAHQELVKMGLPIRKELTKFSDGGSVERKKHLAEINKEMNELVDDAEDAEFPTEIRELTRNDKIVTPDMTVVGKIQEQQFFVTSKFGDLKVQLQDIEHASRDVDRGNEPLRRKLVVNSDNFFQRKPKTTGIRVNRGDRISVRAGGVMQWTNWNKSSSPAGLPSQGQWNSINSGTLIACIGKSQNNVVEVGLKEDWVAKKSGVLYFAISAQDNYVNNNSYRWTGEYEVRVVVTPAPK